VNPHRFITYHNEPTWQRFLVNLDNCHPTALTLFGDCLELLTLRHWAPLPKLPSATDSHFLAVVLAIVLAIVDVLPLFSKLNLQTC
jgi:hypothetical protein